MKPQIESERETPFSAVNFSPYKMTAKTSVTGSRTVIKMAETREEEE